MMLREPLSPLVKNTLILLTSGVVASVFCASVYGATLPVEGAHAASAANATSLALPAPTAHDDAAAAAALRALLAGQNPQFGLGQPASAPLR
jgi:hypothetical protein